MRPANLAIILLGILTVTPPAHAAGRPGAVATDLARAISSGHVDSLRAFVRLNYPAQIRDRPRAVDQVAAYWLSIHREYGPLGPLRIEREDSLMAVAWARGTLTRAWLGLEVGTARDGSIANAAIVRGVRPSFDSAAVAPRATDWRSALRGDLDALRALDLFSGCVVVADRGTVQFEWCGGPRDSSGSAVTPDTRFDIASVGKMFTATAVLRLAGAGKLSLDDPLTKFIPEYPDSVAGRVRIRDLITHRSGIELDDDSTYVDLAREATSVRDLVAAQIRCLPALPRRAAELPLTTFDYSNEGFDLLGAIVERVTGEEFFARTARDVFGPAGMRDTDQLRREPPDPRVARGYTSRRWPPGPRVLGPRIDNRSWWDRRGRPSGGCAASARDLVRFAEALRGGRLLDRGMWERMRTPQVSAGEGESYGLGAMIWTRSGRTSVGHTGGIPGASARLEMFDPDGLTIIALSNYDWVANIAADLARERLGL
jgi:CubicO group peptidase (beta-lactamase class C family)